MIDSDVLRSGRTPFEIREGDSDYSSLSISDRFLAKGNLEKSFFNGVNLSNCAFTGVRLNNTEFCEARVERCHFDETDLSGSDFVDCRFDGVTFSKCVFDKGEWREATFCKCRFIECTFVHTTIALCKFIDCEFDETSISTAEHRAIYFNVFTRCKFARSVTDVVFASRNFGTPARVGHTQLVDATSGTNIEQICLLNNVGQLRLVVLAEVAESICRSLVGKVQRRNSTLTFFSKIVRVLTDERRISATSLIYLEEVVTQFASAVDDQDMFMAAMAAVVEIRSALYSVASEHPHEDARDGAGSEVRRITIIFSPTYARHQAQTLCDALAAATGAQEAGLNIEEFKSGSTFIEIASTTILSTGTVLTGLNYVLRQATITVQRVKGLKQALNQLDQEMTKKGRKVQSAKHSPTKVRAILNSKAAAPELDKVRETVRRSGRTLVEMDEKADVTILAE
jgi:uncharacterized protein YjbI with pentapeptide repeats